MGKFFGGVIFFLAAVFLVYFLNLTVIEFYASNYIEFQAPHVIATLELLHHPFKHLWVVPSWLIAGFLSGLITRSWKGAFLVSLLTGLVLSITWIFFMSRYVPTFWSDFITNRTTLEFLGQTIGIGLLLGLIASGPAITSAHLISPREQTVKQAPIKVIETTCPTCGTTFQSKPKICYKCNSLIESDEKKEEFNNQNAD